MFTILNIIIGVAGYGLLLWVFAFCIRKRNSKKGNIILCFFVTAIYALVFLSLKFLFFLIFMLLLGGVEKVTNLTFGATVVQVPFLIIFASLVAYIFMKSMEEALVNKNIGDF